MGAPTPQEPSRLANQQMAAVEATAQAINFNQKAYGSSESRNSIKSFMRLGYWPSRFLLMRREDPSVKPLNNDHTASISLGIGIKLGSDFSSSGSAKLTVNPVNDVATGEPWIEIHGDASDAVSTASDPLGLAHIIGEASLLSTEGSNPDEISTVGDVLAGSISSDSMIGSKANDLLIGSIAKAEGAQVDVLTGKGGSDVFVLGNEEQSFYAAQGMNDYAHITDFDPTQDQLQLNGDSSYFTAVVEHPDVTGTGIFRSADGKTAGDELIAVLSNENQAVEINRDDFKLV